MENHQIEKNVFFFRTLSEDLKYKIFLACVRNDARYGCPAGICSEDAIRYISDKIADLRTADITIHRDSFVDSYISIKNYVERQYFDIPIFFRAEFVNALLRAHDICPMLNFAFDCWYYSSENCKPKRVMELAELSITYLYRLVPMENVADSAPCGKGAYGVIAHVHDGTVAKIPMNYAAFLFANEEEWEVFQLLKDTELAEHIPFPISFDPHSKKLVREYIPGMTGHELLLCDQMEQTKIDSLREVFSRIQRIQSLYDVRLDLHPANFVWNTEKSRWFFFDLGVVPHIGFDYYPDQFDAYYEKIWKERLDRMVKYPIRSVEL